jgi:hypothetical protein
MKRITSAALALGALMALAPAGAFARGFERDQVVRERVVLRHEFRGRAFEHARIRRDWRETVRFDRCR